MSVEAIAWAFSQPIKHSTAKFVLVAMANHADGDMMCWPSLAHLCAQTSQDRKTVQANILRLRELGYIEDTGDRKGTTKQVIVYHLKSAENGPVPAAKLPENEAKEQANNGHNDTENGPLNPVDNSTQAVDNHAQEAQKRACTENETGPFFPPNRPVFPTKEARFSPETGPKTGHGTIRTIIEPSGTIPPSPPAGNFVLPDWLPSDVWADWVAYRKSIKAKLTDKAAKLCITRLDELRKAGQDPKAVIEQTIMSGKWTGLFPIKDQQQASGNSPKDAWWTTDAGVERKRIEMGMKSHGGESYAALKDRIFAEIRRRGGKAA